MDVLTDVTFLKAVKFWNFISLIIVCAHCQGCILPGKVKANFLAFALHPPTGKLIKEPFLMAIGDVNETASFQYLVEMAQMFDGH